MPKKDKLRGAVVLSETVHSKAKMVEAATRFGSPIYYYDSNILENQFQALRNALHRNVEIFYSIKANPNITICNELRKLGACAEICSYYEIMAALKAGFKPNDIIFVGPAKSNKEIKKCLELGIYAIVCESLTEFKRIAQIAKALGKVASVALRINPDHVSKSALLKMGGKPSQFGMDEQFILEHGEKLLDEPNVTVVGIHIYNGTRILNAATIIENTDYILKLAHRLQTKWGVVFKMVDIGGGLGVPYFSNEAELSLSELKTGMDNIIESYLALYPKTRIILESGRYLVAECGSLISKVVDIKQSKGEWFAVTDGGTNCHMAAVGVGALIKSNFPIEAVTQTGSSAEYDTYNITGPLCTPGDLVGKQVRLPKLSIDDYIIIQNSGAYGPTASPVMFLSHGFPAEVIVNGDNMYLIRDRFNEEDFFNKQCFQQQSEEFSI